MRFRVEALGVPFFRGLKNRIFLKGRGLTNQ